MIIIYIYNNNIDIWPIIHILRLLRFTYIFFSTVYSFIREASFFWVQDQDDTKFKMVTNAYKAKTNVAAVAPSNMFAGAR